MSCFCRFSFNNDDVTTEGDLPSYSIPSAVPSRAVLAGQKGGRTDSGFAAKRKSASHHVVIARRSKVCLHTSVEELPISREPTSLSLILARLRLFLPHRCAVQPVLVPANLDNLDKYPFVSVIIVIAPFSAQAILLIMSGHPRQRLESPSTGFSSVIHARFPDVPI